MQTFLNLLNTVGGQALLVALAGLLTVAAAALGKHLGVTPRQAREVLEAARRAARAGAAYTDTDLAREAQRAIRQHFFGGK